MVGTALARLCPPYGSFTSPRLWGEVGAKRGVRGSLRESDSWREPLTPTLSPQGRGEGAEQCLRFE